MQKFAMMRPEVLQKMVAAGQADKEAAQAKSKELFVTADKDKDNLLSLEEWLDYQKLLYEY